MVDILIFSANPVDTIQLSLDEEAREIQAKIEGSTLSNEIIVQTRWATRIDDLFQAFGRIKPVVVHFSGHGSKSGDIILLDQDGNSQSVTPTAMARFFEVIDNTVSIVVLNACYSEDQAKEICRHVDCVVGMSRSISDNAAIRFSAAFYRALGFQYSCLDAFNQACVTIEMENLKEEDTPKLKSRNSIDPATVYLKKSKYGI